jgi:LPPG:FO 2-phospho-L-lactate transferase
LRRITCLAGGVGAARFLTGLREVIPEKELTVIVNTGDDDEFHGLHVSPDLDIISYTLAGLVDIGKGWGIRRDTFNCLSQLGEYGNPAWFQIGDRDFATHILRTELLKDGLNLTEATQHITSRLGLRCKILPMSNSSVRTMVHTTKGELAFQEYFVREAFQPEVLAINFEGIDKAVPSEEVMEAIRRADGIIISPSNPIVSIGPILALKGLRAALRGKKKMTVAISPIVGGKTLKGPADRMMQSLGLESSAYGIASLYNDIAETLIIDHQDRYLRQKIEDLGTRCIVMDTVMRSQRKKAQLAEAAVLSLGIMA